MARNYLLGSVYVSQVRRHGTLFILNDALSFFLVSDRSCPHRQIGTDPRGVGSFLTSACNVNAKLTTTSLPPECQRHIYCNATLYA